MLAAFWSAPGRKCISAIKGKQTLVEWFDSAEAAMEAARRFDTQRYDVYFAPSLFDPERVESRRQEVNPRTERHYTGREQSCVQAVPALWLDLDAGEGKDYPSAEAALEALVAWLQKVNLPAPTHLVRSGYGLHVYWRLTTPAMPQRWTEVAKHLKQVCQVHGLKADSSRTSDSASLLRVPGTHNHKRGACVPVEVLGQSDDTVDLHVFQACLPSVGPQGAVTRNAVSDKWSVSPTLPPGDAGKIGDKCAQMGMVRFQRGAVEEPVWRAALSILWRCEDKEAVIEAWSDGDPRYDREEALDKASRTEGPATCAHFAGLNPAGCQGCPYAGRVTSPINIAFAEELPETKDGETVTKVHGYTVTKDGIFMDPLTEEGPQQKIADFPIWIEDARELENPHDGTIDARLTIAWDDVRGRHREAPLTHVELHEPRSFTAWLASNNLASFVNGQQMTKYISRMHKERFAAKGARTVYNSLGWYRNGEMFITGGQAISATGAEPATIDIAGPIGELTPKGTVEGWKRAIEPLGQMHLRPLAFGVLVGFAAPLLEIMDTNGAVVVFTGRSGLGKTLAAQVGLSVFMEANEKVLISGASTVNSMAVSMAEHRHTPVVIDEVTVMRTNALRDLIFMIANGSDKNSLNQKRERRAGGTWRTIAMLTSNHSIVESRMEDIEEAHRRRLIEVPVSFGVTKEEGRSIHRGIAENHGVACVPYIQLLLQHRDKLPQLLAIMEQQVEEWGFKNAADRFGAWTLAAALLGGILAYVAGLLPFDPIPVVRSVAMSTLEDRDAIEDPHIQAKEALFELLNSRSKNICHWDSKNRLASVDVEDPAARIDGNILYVRSTELNQVWHEQHIRRRPLRGWLDEVTVGPNRQQRLTHGTPPVQCYAFDMAKLGWNPKEE